MRLTAKFCSSPLEQDFLGRALVAVGAQGDTDH